MLFKEYSNFAIGPPWVSFFFRVELPTDMLVSVMVYAFRFQYGCHFAYRGSTIGVCTTVTLYTWQVYLHPGDGLRPIEGIHRVAFPYTSSSRGSLMLLSQLPFSNSRNMVDIQL